MVFKVSTMAFRFEGGVEEEEEEEEEEERERERDDEQILRVFTDED